MKKFKVHESMASLQDLHKSPSSLRTWRDHRIRLKFQSNSNQSIWLKASNRCKSLMHLQREKATRTKMSERHVVCRRIRPGRRTIDGSLADVFFCFNRNSFWLHRLGQITCRKVMARTAHFT